MTASNPLRILRLLDDNLSASFTLYVYGRSALALGYAESPAVFHATMDVDAILPARDIQALEANRDFWQAQQAVNDALGATGLYFTHLFEERQVILTPDWLQKVVPIERLGFRQLMLRRPSTADLILTKMMRVDPQDREDIGFLLAQRDVSEAEVRRALCVAVVPEVQEIKDAFAENRDWLMQQFKA